MTKRSWHQSLESLRWRINEHLDKIEEERQKTFPNKQVIRHWEKEIKAFSVQLHRLEQRLYRRRKRGKRRR